MNKKATSIWIGLTGEYSSWNVGFNPVGGGLALTVDRGITCEGHRQMFTAHCTNTPEFEDIKVVAEEYRKEWVEAIDKFCELLHAYPKIKKNIRSQFLDDNWVAKEHIAAIFCVDLIKEIAKRAEDRFCSRDCIENDMLSKKKPGFVSRACSNVYLKND